MATLPAWYVENRHRSAALSQPALKRRLRGALDLHRLARPWCHTHVPLNRGAWLKARPPRCPLRSIGLVPRVRVKEFAAKRGRGQRWRVLFRITGATHPPIMLPLSPRVKKYLWQQQPMPPHVRGRGGETLGSFGSGAILQMSCGKCEKAPLTSTAEGGVGGKPRRVYTSCGTFGIRPVEGAVMVNCKLRLTLFFGVSCPGVACPGSRTGWPTVVLSCGGSEERVSSRREVQRRRSRRCPGNGHCALRSDGSPKDSRRRSI